MKTVRRTGALIVLWSTIVMPSFAADTIEAQRPLLLLGGPRQAAITPQAAALAPDGATVLAGYITARKESWATELRADHTVAWTYTGTLSAADGASELKNMLIGPQFFDVVPMADGGTFLCGKMPHAPRSALSTALLTQLDPHGGLVRERLVDLQHAGEETRLFSLDRCIAHQDGILALAHETHYAKPFSVDTGAASSLALVQFDAAGNTVWIKRIAPLESRLFPDPYGSALVVLKQTVVALVTDNVNSEVFAFDANGNITAHKSLAGRYIAVQGRDDHDHVRMVGASEPGGAGVKTLLTLDSALQTVATVSRDVLHAFIPQVIQALPDHAYAMFGFQIEGTRLVKSVHRVGANLKDEQPIPIARRGLLDGGPFAAAPDAQQGAFVMAAPYAWPGASQDSQRGAMVEYLQFPSH